MENDERFLRQQIMFSLDKHKPKGVCNLPVSIKDKVVDAGIAQWRQGNMTGKKAIEWSIKNAKANYKGS